MHAANPADASTTVSYARLLATAGDREEAEALLAEVAPNVMDPFRVEVAMAYAQLGEIELAREQMDRALAFREAGGWIPASTLATGLAAIGETDAALDWLERSFREEGGDWSLRNPGFDPLRAEPRFEALWDEVGLPGAPPDV